MPDIERLRKKGKVKGLIKALRDGDLNTRRAAAEALADIGDPQAVQALVDSVRDAAEDDTVARYILDSRLRPEVEQAEASPAVATWKAVMDALATVAQPAAEALRAALNEERSAKAGIDASRSQRIVALEHALAQLGEFTVDAMLAVYVHEPDVLPADPPSGDALIGVAHEVLLRHNSGFHLARDAYVRTVVSSGAGSLASQEARALEDAPGLMKEMLKERLIGGPKRIDVWSEELTPQIRTVWVVAYR